MLSTPACLRSCGALEKLLSQGETRTEALRLLRRRLSDVVFTALRADQSIRSKHSVTEVHTADEGFSVAA